MSEVKSALIDQIVKESGNSPEAIFDFLEDKSEGYLEKLLVILKRLPK